MLWILLKPLTCLRRSTSSESFKSVVCQRPRLLRDLVQDCWYWLFVYGEYVIVKMDFDRDASGFAGFQLQWCPLNILCQNSE